MVQMEIISRVFRIVFGTSTGTAFTIEDHGVLLMIACCALWYISSENVAATVRKRIMRNISKS